MLTYALVALALHAAPAGKPQPVAATATLQGPWRLDPARGMFSPSGTATVVGPRLDDGRWLVLTAAHCVEGSDVATLVMKTGRKLPVAVLARDAKADCAWCVTDESVDGLPWAALAAKTQRADDAIYQHGHSPLRQREKQAGRVLASQAYGRWVSDMLVEPGDSGAAVFNSKAEVVGVVTHKLTGGPYRSAGPGLRPVRALRLKAILKAKKLPAPVKAERPAKKCPVLGTDDCKCGCAGGKKCKCAAKKAPPAAAVPAPRFALPAPIRGGC